MAYQLVLHCEDGDVIISPPIVPNNPSHGMRHKSIPNEICKTGMSMVKRVPSVIKYELMCGR